MSEKTSLSAPQESEKPQIGRRKSKPQISVMLDSGRDTTQLRTYNRQGTMIEVLVLKYCRNTVAVEGELTASINISGSSLIMVEIILVKHRRSKIRCLNAVASRFVENGDSRNMDFIGTTEMESTLGQITSSTHDSNLDLPRAR